MKTIALLLLAAVLLAPFASVGAQTADNGAKWTHAFSKELTPPNAELRQWETSPALARSSAPSSTNQNVIVLLVLGGGTVLVAVLVFFGFHLILFVTKRFCRAVATGTREGLGGDNGR